MRWTRSIQRSLAELNRKVDHLMSQQDDINADVATLTAAVGNIQAEITALQQANPSLDLSALDAAVQAVAAIVPNPPAPPSS